jgi:hypothetical protein
MPLTVQQSYELLARHGCYIAEICDACGRGIGPVRFTREGEGAVWCSRECRGDGPRRVVRKGGRPRKYRNGEECRAAKTRQQRDYRLRPGVRASFKRSCRPADLADVEKTVCIRAETKDLQAHNRLSRLSPLTPLFPALERLQRENGGARKFGRATRPRGDG